MAVVYEKVIKGQHYSVRSAGASMRLYTNGVFHSQWNKNQPLAGHLWDNLFLPVLFVPEHAEEIDALILGVGGGAVINALNTMMDCKRIVGVDIDKHHLDLAKRYFLDRKDNVTLIQQDAVAFAHGASDKYHYILEDLFCGSEDDLSDAVRPVPVTSAWLRTLNTRLVDNGVLAINFESRKNLMRALPEKVVKQAGFCRRYYLTHPRYENAIAVLIKGKGSLQKKDFTKNLDRLKKDLGQSKFSRLIYTLHGR